jgi:hypothetical protein
MTSPAFAILCQCCHITANEHLKLIDNAGRRHRPIILSVSFELFQLCALSAWLECTLRTPRLYA